MNPNNIEKMEDRRHGHPLNYIQCQCSSAHTFGNVTACIQNWVLNLFPEGLFKTIHVNSKIAHTQLRSTPNEFLKKAPPMFIIRPRIDWDDQARFLNGTLMTERQYNLYNRQGGTNLQPFFRDDKNKIAMKYQLNRHVMNFDVILVFQTLMQQLNWANYFMNAFPYEIPFNIETCLESYLSLELLDALSQISGVPMRDENGSSTEFLRYLNSNSSYPITYKLQGSTGTEEFYRYYPVNIDTIVTGFQTDEGEKFGQINSKYQMTFSIRCEFYGTGFYYLFSDKIKEHTIINIHEDDTTLVPIFTDVLTKEDIDLPLGWKLYASPSCRLEFEDDSISIESLFNDSLKAVMKFHEERGIPFTEFLKIRVRKQGKLLEYGKDYIFDNNKYTIKFVNCNTYYTYKILLFVNIEYVNNLIKQVYKLK